MKVLLKDVTKKFGKRVIFHKVSFSFANKGLYALVGASGSGKSTLLEMIAGIDTKYDGKVVVNKKNLKNKTEDFIDDFRLKNIGYLRQGYDLLELENCLDNIILPLKAVSREDNKFQKKRAKALCKQIDIGDKLEDTVKCLSGGEKQRVGFIRSIINSPSVLLCDEPTGALDEKNAVCIYEKIKEASKTMLVIMVTHDEGAAYKYADCVLNIENNSLNVIKDAEQEDRDIGRFKMKKRSKTKRISSFSWIKHAYHLCKERKKRSLLSFSVLSFSFISLGLATYLSNDISVEINRSFASILGNGSIVMQRSGASSTTIGRTITADENELSKMVDDIPEIKDYGTYYFADFDSYFKDLDTVYIDNGANKITLKGLSIRSINEYLWLDDIGSLECYPEFPKTLEDDQIVLGLPYADMFQICFQLHILRDYEHLGDYIADNGLEIIFSVSNQEWNYDDEQIVSVNAVVPYSVPTIFSYNHRWSEHMYEQRMCFPTTDSEEFTLPWMMQKAFYVKPLNTCSDMMKQLRQNSHYEKFIFEPDNYDYDRSHCKIGQICGTKRYYVFMADKSSISISDIDVIRKQAGIDSFIVGTSYTYTSYPENMMAGFAFPFYATNSVELAEMMVDQATSLSTEQGVTENLPERVVKGSCILPASTSLTISNDFKNLISGYRPTLSSEVAISTSLAKELGNPHILFLVGLVGQEQLGEQTNNEYRIAKVKVCGVVEDSWDRLYVDSYWAIDFFRDELGMSSFLLEPTKCIFEYEDGDSESLMRNFASNFPGYEFKDPSKKVAESSKQVFDYLKISLSLASVSCFVLAFVLLFVTIILTILENAKEGRILFYLGFKRKEIGRSLNAVNILMSLPSIIISLGAVSAMEFFLHRQIGNNFGTITNFVFSLKPVFAILGFGLLSFSIVGIYIGLYVKKRDFKKK